MNISYFYIGFAIMLIPMYDPSSLIILRLGKQFFTNNNMKKTFIFNKSKSDNLKNIVTKNSFKMKQK